MEEENFNESITALNDIEAKLREVKEKQIKKFEDIKISRNAYWQKAEKAYT